MLEKGKQPGSHLLSGAVVNPRGLQRLFKGRKRIDEFPFLGEVAHESVYFMTPKHSFRIPTPPSMRNHGNYVASVSQLGRFLAQEAEAGGATILPETPAESCSSRTGASAASAPPTAAVAGTASSCRTSSPARTSSPG